MSHKLNPGELFPSVKLNIAGGGEINLPDDLNTPITIALFYRGHW